MHIYVSILFLSLKITHAPVSLDILLGEGVDSDMAVWRFRLEVEIAPKTPWSTQVGVDLGTGMGAHLGKEVWVDQ